ncbi:site-specific integrase [Pseudovibrio sp. Ad37]|uniref:tyrosine-type recombinase/integrase n=1 Tax=Pseudovibrio sp. Ad37 TaxID=989422 RepID=UPI0007AE6180|nr:site-specific integrase [Pseudovibrio sp. Ad37]KZL13599.1 Prophage CP4-57 integrase [Pseudovibrio sp. Ad37]
MPSLFRLKPAQLRSKTPGKLSDGGGLYFITSGSGRKSWAYIYTSPITGKRREMGLGSYPAVPIQQAREMAAKWRAVKEEGKDPVAQRNREQLEAQEHSLTLKYVLEQAFEARKSGLKGEGVNGRWWSALNTHVLPKIGSKPIEEVSPADLIKVLKPIWHSKQEVAKKAMQRLKIGFAHAVDMGLDVRLDTTERAKRLLGKQISQAEPFPSMPLSDVPAYYQKLDELGTVQARALQLVILTSRRSGEIRRMRLSDIVDDVWNVPPEDMKGRVGQHQKPQRIPLTEEALRIIELSKPHVRNGYLFPRQAKHSRARDLFLHENAMSDLMKAHETGYVPHGFRATFRTWAAEMNLPYDAAEIQQGHEVRKKVERSYNQADLLEQRRVIMQNWADVVTGQTKKNVLQLRPLIAH